MHTSSLKQNNYKLTLNLNNFINMRECKWKDMRKRTGTDKKANDENLSIISLNYDLAK